MNVKQCENFIKLAETKSLAKAARELFISKQGLSRSIQSLEDELGAVLFVRTIYGMELSPVGESVFSEFAAIVEQYKTIQKKLSTPESQELRILLSFGFFTSISSDLIFSFLKKHKSIQFHYRCCNDSEIEQKLLTEDFDLAFCSNQVHSEQFNYFYLFKNYHCFFVHKDMPLARKRFVETEDLRGLKIAISAPGEYNDYDYLVQRFEHCGMQPDIFPCYESSMLFQFAEEKRGISFAIMNLSQPHPNSDIRCVLFSDYESSAYDINIIVPRGKKLTKPMLNFIGHAQKYCQNELAKHPSFPIIK